MTRLRSCIEPITFPAPRVCVTWFATDAGCMSILYSRILLTKSAKKIVFVTCEILPGEGETVHDEGSGKPVEVHDQSVQSR